MITVTLKKDIYGENVFLIKGRVHDIYLTDDHVLNLGMEYDIPYQVSDKPIKDADFMLVFTREMYSWGFCYVKDGNTSDEWEHQYYFCKDKVLGFFNNVAPQELYFKLKPKKNNASKNDPR